MKEYIILVAVPDDVKLLGEEHNIERALEDGGMGTITVLEVEEQ